MAKSVNKLPKEWGARVLGALDVLDKAAKKQKHNCSHTVDSKKLKKGLKVFTVEDPSIVWTISEIEDKITIKKGTVSLTAKDKESIKRHPTKLFVDQKKAINACIKNIRHAESAILRDMRENLARLDVVNRVKELRVLKKRI